MDKVIVCFCEGIHDVSFLTKLLCTHAFVEYKKPISKLPPPFNSIFRYNSDEALINLKTGYNPSPAIIPSSIVSKEETWIILHNCQGDGSKDTRKRIRRIYEDTFLDDEDNQFVGTSHIGECGDLRFLYFFDADEIGIKKRVKEVCDETSIEEIEHAAIHNSDQSESGCYIFHKYEKETGDLEDLLLKIMKLNNEKIFAESQTYLESNMLGPERQNSFKVKKAIISISGQLQISGVANTVIISRSDYITKEKIMNDPQCDDIIQLFL